MSANAARALRFLCLRSLRPIFGGELCCEVSVGILFAFSRCANLNSGCNDALMVYMYEKMCEVGLEVV